MAKQTTNAVIARAPGGVNVLEWAEIPLAEPGPGEVLIRHDAVGLNFIDTYYRTGLYPWPDDVLIPGAEAAGVVLALGEGVTDLAPGDPVAWLDRVGGYAEHRVIAADRLVKLPEGVGPELAASVLLKGLTAQALVTASAPVQAGQTVLVHAAAGGVGLLLGQWINALGARAIGTAGSDEKVERALAHGYSDVINYRSEDFVARVNELTDGELCHIVFDAVGRDTWQGSLACLRRHGRFVNFGQASGPIDGFTIPLLAAGSKSVIRPVVFDYVATPAELQARASDLFARLASGGLQAQAAQSWPLREAAQAQHALETRATSGATILLP